MRLRLSVTLGCLITVACSGDTPGTGSATQALCNCDIDPAPCCCLSPILIDVAGDGFRLTSSQDGVLAASRPGYERTPRAWTEAGSDDAWLALDRNGDGVINDFSELFGNTTPQARVIGGTPANGFLALAAFDIDENSLIDEADPVFDELRLWQDKNHDGESQPEELHTLRALGVAALSVVFTENRQADAHGNLFRYSASVYPALGSTVGPTAWDVWLVGVQSLPLPGAEVASRDVAATDRTLRYAWRCSSSCTQTPKPGTDPALCLPPSLLTIGPYTLGTQAGACLLAQAQCATTLVQDSLLCQLGTVTCSNCRRTIIDVPDDPGGCR